MGNCRDCKHWRGPSTWNMPYRLPPGTKEFIADPATGQQKPLDPRPYGLCDKARDRFLPDGMNATPFHILPMSAPDVWAELETHADFGCVQFEPKESGG